MTEDILLEKMIVMKKCLMLGTLLASTLTLVGCVSPMGSADVYSGSQTQHEQTVRMGTVESVRAVKKAQETSAIGTLGGAALGGVAGSSIGHGKGSTLAAIAGGLAGAIAGSTLEQYVTTQDYVEITVRLDNGDLRAITQKRTPEIFQAGQRVRLLTGGAITRVTH